MTRFPRTTRPLIALAGGVVFILVAGIVRTVPLKSAPQAPVATRPSGPAKPASQTAAAKAPAPPQSVRARASMPAAPHGSFDTDVAPLFEQTCVICHDDKHVSAGLNIAAYLDPATFVSKRDMWEKILTMLRSGEMPPQTVEQPEPEQVTGLINFVQAELDRIDRTTKPDPGRVTAHRLNRVEYANTIRDLFGVDFRATDEFPADDSGYGFDNNGDVLTVSPALMQKYMSAAERIASRAVGGDPLPSPAIFTSRRGVRRRAPSVTELKQIVDYDADYSIKVSLTGSRGATDPPVTLVISVDGKPVKTVSVPVQMSAVNKQAGGTQRNMQDVTVFLPANEHTFRAEFVNDDEELKKIPEKSRTDQKLNIVPEFIEVAGPFPPAEKRVITKKALVCDPASGKVCVTRILSTLARRAYRRPVTTTDVAQLTRVFDRAASSKYTPLQSLQFAISAMLVSPQFLFRVERDPGAGRSSRISDVELASRLSYFLWSSMPDDQLLRLGETGQLHLPAVMTAQVKRMLADPKSAAFSDNFAGQWLETRSLDTVKRDARRFPDWNTELREAMREETRLFFESIVQENRPVSDFIDAKYTFLNERLAKHYGIEGVQGTKFRRVELTTDQRSGVFTQGSVLTVSSYPTRTSVVLRGKYLLENVLNAPPPPPPADVPALDEAAVGVALSQRVQMEAHRSVPLCASCHTKMDPLGFSLENYDAIGKWRSDDGKFPIDASGTFPNGTSFTGPAGMKAMLRGSMPDFTRSIAEKMLTYALGRGVESYDRFAVKKLVQDTTANGYRIQSLIQGIVKSVPFQQRRGETSTLTSVQEASRK